MLLKGVPGERIFYFFRFRSSAFCSFFELGGFSSVRFPISFDRALSASKEPGGFPYSSIPLKTA